MHTPLEYRIFFYKSGRKFQVEKDLVWSFVLLWKVRSPEDKEWKRGTHPQVSCDMLFSLWISGITSQCKMHSKLMGLGWGLFSSATLHYYVVECELILQFRKWREDKPMFVFPFETFLHSLMVNTALPFYLFWENMLTVLSHSWLGVNFEVETSLCHHYHHNVRRKYDFRLLNLLISF